MQEEYITFRSHSGCGNKVLFSLKAKTICARVFDPTWRKLTFLCSGGTQPQKHKESSPDPEKLNMLIKKMVKRKAMQQLRSPARSDANSLRRKAGHASFTGTPPGAQYGMPMQVPLTVPTNMPYYHPHMMHPGPVFPFSPLPLRLSPPDSEANLSGLSLGANRGSPASRASSKPASTPSTNGKNQSTDSDHNSTVSPLNVSGGFAMSSTPADKTVGLSPASPVTASASCVRSLISDDFAQPLNLSTRNSPDGDNRFASFYYSFPECVYLTLS